MSDSGKSKENSLSSSLDLSSLDSLSLGPNWGSGSMPKVQIHTERSDQDERPGRSGSRRDGAPARRDRRGERFNRGGPGDAPAGAPAGQGGQGGFRGRGDRPERADRGGEGRGERGDFRDRGDRRGGPRREPREIFQPLVECTFYADDAPFKALTTAIRNSSRTYELFEIARLILEKPERYVCLVKHPEQQAGQGAEPKLWACVKDGLPFLSEQEALAHVFKNYLDEFFSVEEVEVEAPSGSFQVIHKCGMTGELLSPPNYHRYQALVQDHHANRLGHVPFERFKSRIESVRDEELVKQWIEKMKKAKRFTLKGTPEGEEPKTFHDLESARFYLLTHQKDQLVRPAFSARFLGKDLTLLPAGDPIRRSVEALHEQQVRFPLDTANHLRGRLRRLNFAVYKKGSKGVSYVSAIKRRFRRPGEVLADNLNDLITFIEAHPQLSVRDLPREYLGVNLPESKEGEDPEAAAASISPEDREHLLNLKRDLRYLITQGYVIEYSDGTLYAPSPRDAEDPSELEGGAPAKPAGEGRGKRNRGPKPRNKAPTPGPLGDTAPVAAVEGDVVEAVADEGASDEDVAADEGAADDVVEDAPEAVDASDEVVEAQPEEDTTRTE